MVVARAALLVVLLAAGCASVQVHPTEVAVTALPVDQHFGIAGELRLPAGTPLVLAAVDGQKAYCSTVPVAFNPGEGRGACFFDVGGHGYFDRWYMLGTISSATMENISIPYSVVGMDAFKAAAATRAAMAPPGPSAGEVQRAHADCVYQAQMANVTTPGLVNGLLTGIVAGSVCENYYRNIGVIQ